MPEDKRLGPAELRKQQEERERNARDAEAREREKGIADRRSMEIAANEKAAAEIKASWYKDVVAATNRDGVRFLVLAEIIDSGMDVRGVVGDVIATLKADGYTCEDTSVQLANAPRGAGSSLMGKDALVTDHKGVTGWKPAKLPRIGSNGAVSYLIVRW